MKKSAKALLGAGALFFGSGLAMNTFVLTRASKKFSEFKKEIEEKKNPTDMTVPKEILRAEGDAWVDSKDYDHIVIKNRKNEPIHSLVVKSDEESDKWLICIHGYTSSPKGMGSYALHYHKRGYNVLLPCLRGHDISEHRSITMGWLDRLDIIDWIQYLSKTYNNPQIVLHGVSMGAATVLMASSLPLPDAVKAIIADCPYSSPKAIIQKVSSDVKLPPRLAYPFVVIGALVFGKFRLWQSSPVEAVRRTNVPILLIHGDDDRFVPCEMSEEIFDACGSGGQLMIVPGAGHALSYFVDTELYVRTVSDFLRLCDVIS